MNNHLCKEHMRRENADGTFDSICLNCFQTIGSGIANGALVESKRLHKCSGQNPFALHRQDVGARQRLSTPGPFD
jgi:hypothetical protein